MALPVLYVMHICDVGKSFQGILFFNKRLQIRVINIQSYRFVPSRMSSLVWLMVLCWSTLVSSQKASNIFILAGQSNMAGRGGVRDGKKWDGVVPAEDKPSPQILRFSHNLTWEEARDPLHHDIDPKECGVGPGMAFANTLLAKQPSLGVMGLVPCAVGGTTIGEWARGKKLYNDMISRTKAALIDGGTLRGLMWFQGESNTGTVEDARAYKTNYEQFIRDVRAELQFPALPVVQVLIASGDNFSSNAEAIQQLRESQKAVELQNLKSVDAWGLPLLGDKVHLTAESAVRVGQMLADAFLNE